MTPESDSAKAAGCRCRNMDGWYWIDERCPLHAEPERCPRCGEGLPTQAGEVALCLCPRCGCRVCEGGV